MDMYVLLLPTGIDSIGTASLGHPLTKVVGGRLRPTTGARLHRIRPLQLHATQKVAQVGTEKT